MSEKYNSIEKDILHKLHISGSVLSENNYHGIESVLVEMIGHFQSCMFPYQFGDPVDEKDEESKRKYELFKGFESFKKALGYVMSDKDEIGETALVFIQKLPEIYNLLQSDIQAGYEGDPAAASTDDIILCYPAFKAICTYRLAHVMYELKIPTLPRIMSEYAHERTGIDIHPGATIGGYFFIDHGTGVVIGETTVIGERVKLYQHVTLGAKSFAVNEDGTLVKGIKRHPNLGNNVVVYAGATILGGDTYIGDNCVIGGNVWLTHSVPEGSTVYNN